MPQIRDILMRQKKELSIVRNRKYIQRDIPLPELHKSVIKVITGPRRAGKSFFALHELINFGYVNFDDESIADVDDYDEIVHAINSVYNETDMIFLDEIQNLERWELFVNRLQRTGHNLIISGSNANLLSRELSTHLTGRHTNIIVFPFSFKEYLTYFGDEPTNAEKKSRLEDYLESGGYPEPLVNDLDYRSYLKTLLEAILFKDIITRYNPGYPGALEQIARFLISNFSNLISYRSIKDFTDIGSVHTVKKYISYLEETFLLFELKRFSFKLKEQERANKKIYVIDPGLINATSFSFSSNLGRLYENLVAIELKKKQLKGELEFYYYKKEYEVDFVVQKKGTITNLIQVCCDVDDSTVWEREVRGLLYAQKYLGCRNLTIITNSKDDTEEIEWFGMKGEITSLPLWKWLLDQ